MVERPLEPGLPELVVGDGRLAAIALAQAWYGAPGLPGLVGITGTSGKTTTTLSPAIS